jgi:hypothetical protein
MRKLQLKIEDLQVTSFDTDRTPVARGTVEGNNKHPATTIHDLTCAAPESCAMNDTCFDRCPFSGVDTCDVECASADTECQNCWV